MLRPKYDAFVSHRRSDGQSLALAIREYFRGLGYAIYMDVSESKPGDFSKHLRQAVTSSRYVLALKTPDLSHRGVLNTNTNEVEDWVALELQIAQHNNIPVICIEDTRDGLYPVPVVPYQKLDCTALSLDTVLRSLSLTVPRSSISFIRSVFLRARLYFLYALTLILITALLWLSLVAISTTAPAARGGSSEIRSQINKIESAIEALKKRPTTTYLLIDSTGTMHDKLTRVMRHSSRILESIPTKEVVVVIFSDKGEDYVVKEWRRGGDSISVVNSIVQIPMTNGGDEPEASDEAMKYTRELYEKEGHTKGQVILFTDAPANNPEFLFSEVRKLIQLGAEVTMVSCDNEYEQLGWRKVDGISFQNLIVE